MKKFFSLLATLLVLAAAGLLLAPDWGPTIDQLRQAAPSAAVDASERVEPGPEVSLPPPAAATAETSSGGSQTVVTQTEPATGENPAAAPVPVPAAAAASADVADVALLRIQAVGASWVEDESFDLVLGHAVLHHIPDLDRILQQLAEDIALMARPLTGGGDAPGGPLAERTQAWLQTLPGIAQTLGGRQLQGQARLDARWRRLCRTFYRDWPSHTPWFREIPREFVRYLSEHHIAQPLPVWLADLARYEWAELAVDVMDVTPPAHDPQGDMMLSSVCLNPARVDVVSAWPVHRIGPDWQPRQAEPTFLVVFRDAQLNVQFTEINAVTAHVLGEAAGHVGEYAAGAAELDDLGAVFLVLAHLLAHRPRTICDAAANRAVFIGKEIVVAVPARDADRLAGRDDARPRHFAGIDGILQVPQPLFISGVFLVTRARFAPGIELLQRRVFITRIDQPQQVPDPRRMVVFVKFRAQFVGVFVIGAVVRHGAVSTT